MKLEIVFFNRSLNNFLLATVVSDTTPQTTENTFINQEDSCASKQSDDVLTIKGASVSLEPITYTQSEKTQRLQLPLP